MKTILSLDLPFFTLKSHIRLDVHQKACCSSFTRVLITAEWRRDSSSLRREREGGKIIERREQDWEEVSSRPVTEKTSDSKRRNHAISANNTCSPLQDRQRTTTVMTSPLVMKHNMNVMNGVMLSHSCSTTTRHVMCSWYSVLVSESRGWHRTSLWTSIWTSHSPSLLLILHLLYLFHSILQKRTPERTAFWVFSSCSFRRPLMDDNQGSNSRRMRVKGCTITQHPDGIFISRYIESYRSHHLQKLNGKERTLILDRIYYSWRCSLLCHERKQILWVDDPEWGSRLPSNLSLETCLSWKWYHSTARMTTWNRETKDTIERHILSLRQQQQETEKTEDQEKQDERINVERNKMWLCSCWTSWLKRSITTSWIHVVQVLC